jgi:HD domain
MSEGRYFRKRLGASVSRKALGRRRLLKMIAAAPLLARLASASDSAAQTTLPVEVAGVRLPHSALALAAVAFARQNCPDFLINHCLRTFTFGALLLQRQRRRFNVDTAFVAAALHDLGLLEPFESIRGSFEIDGADAAEKFMLGHHRSAADADQVWHAVELHDGKWALTARQGPEAMLVSLGAGADVYGPDPGELEARQIAEVLAAFPRLQFKQRFTSLLIAHCERKPNSQRATWLEDVCRAHAPAAAADSVEQHIAAADFPE